MVNASRRAALVPTSQGPVHVIVHADPAAGARDTAVLLLPPFGLDDVHSYRPRRDWADALAGGGYLAARMSYPATGDSGGTPIDPGMLDAWTDAVVEVATWLRERFRRSRLALIGIELGGVLACRAVDRGLAVRRPRPLVRARHRAAVPAPSAGARSP